MKLAAYNYCRGITLDNLDWKGREDLQFCILVLTPQQAGLKSAEVGQTTLTNLLPSVYRGERARVYAQSKQISTQVHFMWALE